MRDGFRQRGVAPPIQVGEELDVKIEAVGEKGDGIAKKDGFVLFVPGTNEGDEVRVKVTKVLRRVGFAEKVGEGSGSADAPSEAPAEEAEAPAEKTEEKKEEEIELDESKDSEDFGEETEGEKKEEEAVEEEKKEETS